MEAAYVKSSSMALGAYDEGLPALGVAAVEHTENDTGLVGIERSLPPCGKKLCHAGSVDTSAGTSHAAGASSGTGTDQCPRLGKGIVSTSTGTSLVVLAHAVMDAGSAPAAGGVRKISCPSGEAAEMTRLELSAPYRIDKGFAGARGKPVDPKVRLPPEGVCPGCST